MKPKLSRKLYSYTTPTLEWTTGKYIGFNNILSASSFFMRNSQFTQKKCYPHQRSPRQMEIKFSDQHAYLKLHSKTPTFLRTSRLVLQFKRSFIQRIFLKASVLKARIHIIYTLFKAKIFPVGAALRQFSFMATVSSSALEGCKLSLFQ